MTTPEETHPNPSSPAGQVESTGAFAIGLTRMTGWRRQAARWAVVLLLATPLVAVIVGQLVR
jgi:hypothetical protein